MKRFVVVAVLPLIAGIVIGVVGSRALEAAQQAAPKRTMLITVDLPEIPGKEMRMFITDFPPGATTTKHQHPGHMVAYMETGALVQTREGRPARTIRSGGAWEEKPGEVHVGANASKTRPARLIGVGIFDKGAPLSVTVP